MDQQLRRIQEKLKDRMTSMNPRLNVEELCQFERNCRVSLPEDYREFITHVGNGGIGPPAYGLNALDTSGSLAGLHRHAPSSDLHRITEPFPFTKLWIWDNDQVSPEGTRDQIGNGSILLGTDGCGMDWHLIVTGPDRVVPWMIAGEGIQPVCPKRNFIQWYEDWLDGLDSFYGYSES